MSTTGIACRATTRPRLLCRITEASLRASCELIAARIKEASRARGAASLLFIASNGDAYLIQEDHPASQTWFRERFRDYVGLYRIGRAPHALEPTLEGLLEDVADHLGFVGAPSGARVPEP